MSMRLSFLAWVLLVGPAAAQAFWFQPTLTTNPPPRDTHELATEPVSGKIVLFGGVLANNAGQLNDTWEWNGQAWTQIFSSVSPSARESHAMASDGQGGIILFGGYGGWNDTWRFAQGQWTQLLPATTPPPRRYHKMAHTGQGILMFGGFEPTLSGLVHRSDTWEWNGADWIQRTPATTPPARHAQGFAYDPSRSRVVMFGGVGQGSGYGTPLQDTWEWDGTDWQQRFPSTSPPSGYGVALAYHPGIAKCVLYGGYAGSSASIPLCWTWDGTNWTQVALTNPNPGPRGTPLAWSPASQGLLLFGGLTPVPGSLGDTWLTAPTIAAAYSPLGTGCQGSAGLPTLAPATGSLPRLGQSFRLELTSLPLVATVVIGSLGFSSTMNNSIRGTFPLPADLGIFGMTGCTQYVSDDFAAFILALSGQANWSIPIPANARLAGLTFHVQGLVFDQGSNPFGATVTNAGTCVVGG